MKALILGGSGATGKLLQGLIANSSPTRAELDPTNPQQLERSLEGCDAVVCLLSAREKSDPIRSRTAAALIPAMKAKGVRRVIWVSSSGVGDSLVGAAKTSFIFTKLIIPLALKRQFADAALAEEALRNSGLDYTVLRPMQLVDGERKGEAQAIAPDVKAPSAKISRAQLARFIAKELATPSHVGQMPVLHG